MEYRSGTDPRNANSYLHIEDVAAISGQMVISFTAVGGKTYYIQYRQALGTGANWQPLLNNQGQTLYLYSSSNQYMSVTDTGVQNPANVPRFYRLVVSETAN
jgi:hypothetical protein